MHSINSMNDKTEKDMNSLVFQTFLHEVKNPLAILQGNISLMELYEAQLLDSKRWLSIKNNISHLCNLLNDFSALNKMTMLEKTKFNVVSCMYEVYNMFISLADQKSINFYIDNNFDDEVLLNGDQSKIKHGVINLIKNAFEACNAGDSIYIYCQYERNQVSIVVEDTGCGMTPTQARSVTTPFTTYKQNGTGLGLALVKWLTDNHNGELKIKSKADVGSQFTMLFPCH